MWTLKHDTLKIINFLQQGLAISIKIHKIIKRVVIETTGV